MTHPSKNVKAHTLALTLRLEGRTYSEIGRALGVTHQRAQQMTHAPKKVRAAVIERAGRACESCEMPLPKRGHIHHRAAKGMTPETYNSEPNLMLLCTSCHRRAHADPAVAARKRERQTPEARAARAALRAYRSGAYRLGISCDEYRAHREQGELWCWVHTSWEPSARFGANKGLCAEANREVVKRYQTAAYKRDYYRRNAERLNAYSREWKRRRREPLEAVS